jgi:hypothetical protein
LFQKKDQILEEGRCFDSARLYLFLAASFDKQGFSFFLGVLTFLKKVKVFNEIRNLGGGSNDSSHSQGFETSYVVKLAWHS